MSISMQLQKSACRGWVPPAENFGVPIISSLSIYASNAGATAMVSVFGSNFYSYSSVLFGNEIPSVQFVNSNLLQFYVPTYLSAGTYPVQISNGASRSNIVNYLLEETDGFWQQQSDGSIANTNANASSSAGVAGTGIVRIGGLSLAAPLTIDDDNAAQVTSATVGQSNWIICNVSSSYTLPLPSAAQYIGRQLMVKSTGGTVFASQAVYPQNSADPSSLTTVLLEGSGNWATIVTDGTSWIVMQSG
jgi:hypothetical protein